MKFVLQDVLDSRAALAGVGLGPQVLDAVAAADLQTDEMIDLVQLAAGSRPITPLADHAVACERFSVDFLGNAAEWPGAETRRANSFLSKN